MIIKIVPAFTDQLFNIRLPIILILGWLALTWRSRINERIPDAHS